MTPTSAVHRQGGQRGGGRTVANDDAGEPGIERQRSFHRLGETAGRVFETLVVSGEVEDSADGEVGKTKKIVERHGA